MPTADTALYRRADSCRVWQWARSGHGAKSVSWGDWHWARFNGNAITRRRSRKQGLISTVILWRTRKREYNLSISMYALQITLLTRMYDCVRDERGGGVTFHAVSNVKCLAIYRAMSQAVYNWKHRFLCLKQMCVFFEFKFKPGSSPNVHTMSVQCYFKIFHFIIASLFQNVHHGLKTKVKIATNK